MTPIELTGKGKICPRCEWAWPKPDWKQFLDTMGDDLPNDPIIYLARCLSKITFRRPLLVICSGRPDTHRHVTEWWLARHQIPYDYLLLRGKKDNDEDHAVKQRMLNRLKKEFREPPIFVVDDRGSVVRMWRKNGIVCLQVADTPDF